MKLLKSVITLGLALSVLAWAEPSQAGIGKSGITGGAFLKIGVGARAVALGSAFTSVSGDANQFFGILPASLWRRAALRSPSTTMPGLLIWVTTRLE